MPKCLPCGLLLIFLSSKTELREYKKQRMRISHTYFFLIFSFSWKSFSRKEVFPCCILTFACAAVELQPEYLSGFSRKEVFQPHLPVRLPCYDLAPITSFTLGRPSRSQTSGAPGFHGLTGGVYKARERIHRAMADARLLANPASWGRVADPNPNYDAFY